MVLSSAFRNCLNLIPDTRVVQGSEDELRREPAPAPGRRSHRLLLHVGEDKGAELRLLI